MLNYQKISLELLEYLPERTRDVIERRFGLEGKEKETLETVGKSYGITRERVRQIQDTGLLKLKRHLKNYREALEYFADYLKKRGDLKEEKRCLNDLGERIFQNNVYFLLSLGEDFERFSENIDLHSLWTINEESLGLATKVIEGIEQEFKKIGSPLVFENIFGIYEKEIKDSLRTPLSKEPLLSYIEVSKRIEQGPQGAFGLREWGEINPRGIRDKAFIALKQKGEPLHFREVAAQINNLDFEKKKEALPQTVHNELIKDNRFILVGRGLYALREWGYEPGVVKDVIFRILKEKGAIEEDKIIEEVLKKRFVEKNTVLMNLKKHFSKGKDGKYRIV